MAYIGRGINNLSNAQILDTITFTNSAGPYNLEQGSAAFTPISPQAFAEFPLVSSNDVPTVAR